MKDYSKHSDLEINKAVAECFCLNFDEKSPWCFNPDRSSRIEWLNMDGTSALHSFDWCNDDSDWVQLMVNNRMALYIPNNAGNEWQASWSRGAGITATVHATHIKPGRAVAICFLMMKDAENANN